MKAMLLPLVAVPSLALAMGLGAAAIGGRLGRAPVYSVAAVGAGLRHDPSAWADRTLLVRGVAVASVCPLPPDVALCVPRFGLRDPDPATAREQLDLAWGSGGPLLAALRRVPLLGAILPAPQAIRWERVATYRVSIRAAADARCGAACAELVLPDAAP